MSIHTTDLDSWRDKIIVDIGGQKSLARWSWTELSRLELFPGSELGRGRITVPESWLPSGPQRRLSARSVDLFVVGDVELSVKARRCEWLGRAGAALWLPYTSMNGAKVASPWTWLSRARLINRMRDHAVKLMSDDEWDLWPYLAELAKDGHRILTENERTKQDFDHIIRILSDSSRDGLMIPLASTPADLQVKSSVEQSYQRRDSTKTKKPELPGGKFRPFPNAFVTKCLGPLIWLQDNLADQILDCWEQTELLSRGSTVARADIPQEIKDLRRRVFEAFKWTDEEGKPLTSLPFSVRQREDRSYWESSTVWPPRHYGTLPAMVSLIQAGNISVLAFTTAARHHELAGTEEQALAEAQETITARTYKTSGRVGGKLRDWPLHPIAAKALRIQERLARIVRNQEDTHLWVQTRDSSTGEQGSPLSSLTKATEGAVTLLGLTDEADGPPHIHRWRYTTTKIIALTVDEAQEVLMDLLGHEDPESVLGYMLGYPDLAAEAIRISDEASHVLAIQAVNEVLDNTASGAAAPRIRESLDEFRMSRGIRRFGTDDIEEAARILTLDGTAFRRVRKGVLCTKAPGQAAPCTKARGNPDIGSCRTDCLNRLELEVEKADFELEIRKLLEEYLRVPDEFEMVKARLEGQLRASARRWPEDGAKFLRKNMSSVEYQRVFYDEAA